MERFSSEGVLSRLVGICREQVESGQAGWVRVWRSRGPVGGNGLSFYRTASKWILEPVDSRLTHTEQLRPQIYLRKLKEDKKREGTRSPNPPSSAES